MDTPPSFAAERLSTESHLPFLATSVESSQDAVITKSIYGTILSWNPAAERIFGYSAIEAIGRPISMIVPPDRATEEPEILSRIRRGEKLEHFETSRLRKDGRRIVVSLTISPVRDGTGQIVGASKIARDVTQQKTNERAMQLERERLHVMLASIGDGVIVTDLWGCVEFLNPVAEALTGWKQADATGKPLDSVFNIINENTRCRVESPVTRAMREGAPVGLANHTILVAQDGTEVAIDDSAAPIRDPQGNVSGVILVFRDVSGQRAVEAVRARLSAIVESSDDAIIGKDLEGRITSWNRGAEKIFGYTPLEAIGRPITMLIPPERLAEEPEIMARLRRGQRVEHFETVRIAKDRRKVDVSVSISPILDSYGAVVGASKIARDITDRKRSERELEHTNARLKQHADELELHVAERTAVLRESLAELETFSSSLSHDLKAPLRAIAFHTQTICEDYGEQLPAEIREKLQRIMSSCVRLTRFIDNVLTYARVRTGALPLTRVSLDTLVPVVLHDHPHIAEKHAEVSVEPPLLPVLGHEGLLTQVISNLVSNGVKFVKSGIRPKLRIWTERLDDRVRFCVDDNGIGIAVADHQKIFRLFTRLGGSDSYDGSGVGLAVVQRAVWRMGGTVGVESEKGRGSRFWFELPAATPPPPELLEHGERQPHIIDGALRTGSVVLPAVRDRIGGVGQTRPGV